MELRLRDDDGTERWLRVIPVVIERCIPVGVEVSAIAAKARLGVLRDRREYAYGFVIDEDDEMFQGITAGSPATEQGGQG